MRVYRVELMVIDFDGLGEKGIAEEIRYTRYPNDCIHPRVVSVAGRDIGEWDDGHPLNHSGWQQEFERIFNGTA